MRGAARLKPLPFLVAALAAWPGSAAAAPITGRHATIEQQWTTTLPHAPMGSSFTGRYHAEGDPGGDPPFMRRMKFYLPRGMRYDTSVPRRCAASDRELQLRGAAACPEGSQLGGGEVQSKLMGFASTLRVDVFNNTDEMIMLARSPILTSVTRGTIRPNGSIEFAGPTCFPSIAPVGCPVDTALQLGSSITIPPYVSSSGGVVRSYATTPRCPRSRTWRTRVRLWWADGSDETITTAHPCTTNRPRSRRSGRRQSTR